MDISALYNHPIQIDTFVKDAKAAFTDFLADLVMDADDGREGALTKPGG